jgi:GGDEF domain-containing protein
MFPKHRITADMLVKRADEVMYRAKENKSGYAFTRYEPCAMCGSAQTRKKRSGILWVCSTSF